MKIVLQIEMLDILRSIVLSDFFLWLNFAYYFSQTQKVFRDIGIVPKVKTKYLLPRIYNLRGMHTQECHNNFDYNLINGPLGSEYFTNASRRLVAGDWSTITAYSSSIKTNTLIQFQFLF